MPITTRSYLQFDISEIKQRADIREVWAALGGGKLRHRRGQAWWRGGDGYNVALYPESGTWHDFATRDGGDIVELVRTVKECGFLEAANWLARHTGVAGSACNRRDEATADWRSDLEAATWWRMAAVILAEATLASISCYDPARRDLTALVARIRLGDAALVDEYRAWRKRHPRLTAAMTRAGQRSDARKQRRLALWLREYLDEHQAA